MQRNLGVAVERPSRTPTLSGATRSATIKAPSKPIWLAKLVFLLACLAVGWPNVARADYPEREIRLAIGFPAGSGADIVVRYMAEKLRLVSGATVIVDNKPGAAGNLAATYVAKAKPDGYTVLTAGGTGLASSISLFKEPPINPLTDVELLGTIFKQPWTIIVDAKSPYRSLQDLTARLKEKGEKGAYGVATPTGIVMAEIYKSMFDLKTTQVNYRTGGDGLNDLLNGNLDMLMSDPGFTLGQMTTGKIRALAVSTATRSKAFSSVPTMAEGGAPGIDLQVWWVTAVPAGTPAPIKDKLRGWFDQILRMPETERFFADNGADLFLSTPQEASAYLRDEMKNWQDYVRRARIEPQ